MNDDESAAQLLHHSALVALQATRDAGVTERNQTIRLFEELLCTHPAFAARHRVAHDFVRRVLLANVDAARRDTANKPVARRTIAVAAQLLVRLWRKLLLARAQLHADRPPQDAAALLAAQCVVFVALGDLARYAADLGANSLADSRLQLRQSARFYALALRLAPAHGHAHNQLGLVANTLRRRDVALYRYARALFAADPFDGARDNLLAVADRIRSALADSDDADAAANKRARSAATGKPASSATKTTTARPLSVADKFGLLYARCIGILVSGTDVEKLDELLKRTLQQLQTLLRDERRARWSVRSAVSSLWLALAAARLASRTDSLPRRAALRCGARRLLLGLLACAVEHIARNGDVSKTSDDAAQSPETSLDACAAVAALFLDWQRAIAAEASAVALPDDAEAPAIAAAAAAATADNAPAAIDYSWRSILLREPLGDLACVALWRACWNSLPRALSAAAQRLQRRRGLWPSTVRALPDDIEVHDDDLLRAQQGALRFPLADPRAEWHWDASELVAARAARLYRAGLWLCGATFSTTSPLVFRTAADLFTGVASEAGTPAVADKKTKKTSDDDDGHDDDDDDEEVIIWQPDVAAPVAPHVAAMEQPAVSAPPALPLPREPSMFPNQRVFDLFVRSSGKLDDVWRDQMSTDETFAGVFALFDAPPPPPPPPAPPAPASATSAPLMLAAPGENVDSGFFGDLALLGDDFGELSDDNEQADGTAAAPPMTESTSGGDLFLQQFFQLPNNGQFDW